MSAPLRAINVAGTAELQPCDYEVSSSSKHDLNKGKTNSKYMRNDYTCLREYIANTVARNIRRSTYAGITLANVVGITVEMTWFGIVARVMGVRRKGTLLSLR